MLYRLDTLMREASNTRVLNRHGNWVPARPMRGPFLMRLSAAWAVLRGKADAVIWPDGQ